MVRDAGADAAERRHTKIKLLNGTTVYCDSHGCNRKAGYLFRTGEGPIEALCEVHASEAACKIGVPLPESAVQVLRMGLLQ
jgi:hypothetical protein